MELGMAKEWYEGVDEKVGRWAKKAIEAKAGVELTSAPATRGLPTIDTPTVGMLVLASYLVIVGLGTLRIRISGLKPRGANEPLFIRSIVLLHNMCCLLLSLYMCSGILFQAFRLKYSVWGNPYKKDEKEMAFFIYLFYMSKLFELMDTIIMLIKRNLRQITVLHVYHHSSIAVIWWVIAHHAPGGDAYFSAAMNSAVHVVMYFYYLLSSILRNKDDKLRHKYLFWGKYLTQIQMIQFGVNMAQAYYCIKTEAPYPIFLCKTLFYYMISLLFLFYNFYLHKYTTKQFSTHQKKVE